MPSIADNLEQIYRDAAASAQKTASDARQPEPRSDVAVALRALADQIKTASVDVSIDDVMSVYSHTWTEKDAGVADRFRSTINAVKGVGRAAKSDASNIVHDVAAAMPRSNTSRMNAMAATIDAENAAENARAALAARAPRRAPTTQSLQNAQTTRYAPPAPSMQDAPTSRYVSLEQSLQNAPTTRYAPPAPSMQDAPTSRYVSLEQSLQNAPTTRYAPPAPSMQDAPTSRYVSLEQSLRDPPTTRWTPPSPSLYDAPTVRDTPESLFGVARTDSMPRPQKPPQVPKFQPDAVGPPPKTPQSAPTGGDMVRATNAGPPPKTPQSAPTGGDMVPAGGPTPTDGLDGEIIDVRNSWMLPAGLAAAGGLGSVGAYQYGRHESDAEAKRMRNLAFGAGLASGVAAPRIAQRAGGMLASFGQQNSGAQPYGY